ncbi:unnamed protein product [Nippostrongylus brasiliensis]|uniref:THAP-type domain-containing protein n=1 Tax=Nippostrongylus brasiliensis TaxID=27835 RepID=A0A0N4XEU7_NIPBR|nr:unnamed protein product [Nippostrongylus brasiliensis]
MESMSRATKSNVGGERLRVSKRPDGKLSIFPYFHTFQVYDRGRSAMCVVCRRTIADLEMFLNFPDDLDRRRLWGNMLGFKYSDMLRLRDGSFALSTGLICTDHFSDECLYLYINFQTAIETLGMPSVTSPGVKLTPSKKWYDRIPWDCTVCSFQSHSVCAMQKHMVEHSDDVPPRGLLCPFCRKCTYGYKTMSGLRRHLMTPPTQHSQLRRIFEIARSNCRSSLLEPAAKWSSWTDRNVYLAYHGCEPPPRTPRKRPGSGMDTQADAEHSPSPTPVSEKPQTPRITPANSSATFVTPTSRTPRPSLVQTRGGTSKKSTHLNPRRPLIFASPVKRDVNGVAKPSKTLLRPVTIFLLLIIVTRSLVCLQ